MFLDINVSLTYQPSHSCYRTKIVYGLFFLYCIKYEQKKTTHLYSDTPKRIHNPDITVAGKFSCWKTALVHCYEKMVEKEQGKEEKKDPTLSEQASIKTVATDFVNVDITVKGKKNEDVPVKVKIWDSQGKKDLNLWYLTQLKIHKVSFLFMISQ